LGILTTPFNQKDESVDRKRGGSRIRHSSCSRKKKAGASFRQKSKKTKFKEVIRRTKVLTEKEVGPGYGTPAAREKKRQELLSGKKAKKRNLQR
jgi:hypothetical protein